MLCDNFECMRKDENGECDEMGGECIPDMCEDWGECRSCQKVGDPDDCWKGRNKSQAQ